MYVKEKDESNNLNGKKTYNTMSKAFKKISQDKYQERKKERNKQTNKEKGRKEAMKLKETASWENNSGRQQNLINCYNDKKYERNTR